MYFLISCALFVKGLSVVAATRLSTMPLTPLSALVSSWPSLLVTPTTTHATHPPPLPLSPTPSCPLPTTTAAQPSPLSALALTSLPPALASPPPGSVASTAPTLSLVPPWPPLTLPVSLPSGGLPSPLSPTPRFIIVIIIYFIYLVFFFYVKHNINKFICYKCDDFVCAMVAQVQQAVSAAGQRDLITNPGAGSPNVLGIMNCATA